MARRSIVPVTRATGLGTLPQLLVNALGEHALHRAFSRHGLGLAATEHGNLHLPHTAMLDIFDHAADRVGARDFGLRVGQSMRFPSYGLWAEYCASAPTLREAIQRLLHGVRYQHSRDVMAVEYECSFAVLRYYPMDLGVPTTQHSDHLLYPMLRLARFYLGARWQPAWFELDYPRDANADEIETQLAAPVRFGMGSVGMAVPVSLLDSPRIIEHRAISLSAVEADDPVRHFKEPLRSITLLAILRLMEGRTDIDGTASLAGMSARTLQRSLAEEGLTYRGLLDMIRMRRAKQLLSKSNLTITQIALALGYSEHANFTRAFTRWMGQPPFEYRLHARKP